jgi:hypothetical protein
MEESNMPTKHRLRSWFRVVSATAIVAGAMMNLATFVSTGQLL